MSSVHETGVHETGVHETGVHETGVHGASDGRSGWTFLTNHAHVLIAISRDPELRQRDISRLVGITEGAVQRILHELEDAGILRRERIGRRNRYEIDAQRPLRHPLERDHPIADLLRAVNEEQPS